MTDESARWCALFACSETEHWAVPQKCLAEIVTLVTDEDHPPEMIDWRDTRVPIMNLSPVPSKQWRDQHMGTGLIAVFLGIKDGECDYWGVAINASGLGVKKLADTEIEDLPNAVSEHATAAFRLGDTIYQVPDLAALQGRIANRSTPPQSAAQPTA